MVIFHSFLYVYQRVWDFLIVATTSSTILFLSGSRRSLWENADKVDRLPPPAQCENPKYLAPRHFTGSQEMAPKSIKKHQKTRN